MFCRYQIKKICGIVLRKNKITVAGNKMEIDWQDAGLSKELVAYGGREFFSTKYIKDFMTEDEIMVDIGANIGYYTVTAAKRATGGRVYAIEPVKDNIKILRSNIK